MNLENFDWGKTSNEFRDLIIKELFEDRIYEKHFEVEFDDILVDIGSSIGDFVWSILDKNPKHIWVVEPTINHFVTLKKNLMGRQVSFTNAAITNSKSLIINWDGHISRPTTKTFGEFIKENGLEKIDFLKGDCEGCEYDIFSDENINFLSNNVRKLVFEFHLNDYVEKAKFRHFRNNHIKRFRKVIINSVDGFDIGWDLWNEHFIEYYTQVLIYIDNR